jgi:hypothetical protein
MENSFWTVRFFSPNTGDHGDGVVLMMNGKLFGGDSYYYYIGSYNIIDNYFGATIDVTHFSGQPLAIFGQSLNLKIRLSGQVQEPVMKLKGHLVNNPSLRAEVVCTKVTQAGMSQKKEGLFYEGQYYDAQRVIKTIFSDADQKIILIDNYVDDIVLDLLTVKKPKVEVNILGKTIKPSFKASAITFSKQYGNLSIRTSKSFHDRFLIIDEKKYYHFGASIKDLGNLTFMFSLIEEESVVNSLKAKLSQEWAVANVEI